MGEGCQPVPRVHLGFLMHSTLFLPYQTFHHRVISRAFLSPPSPFINFFKKIKDRSSYFGHWHDQSWDWLVGDVTEGTAAPGPLWSELGRAGEEGMLICTQPFPSGPVVYVLWVSWLLNNLPFFLQQRLGGYITGWWWGSSTALGIEASTAHLCDSWLQAVQKMCLPCSHFPKLYGFCPMHLNQGKPLVSIFSSGRGEGNSSQVDVEEFLIQGVLGP